MRSSSARVRPSLCALCLATASLAACRGTTPTTPEPSPTDPAAATATTDDACQPASEEEISIDNGVGTVHGTLLLPQGCPPFDIVLLHVGSGPTDRDGNTPMLPGSNNGHRMLAETFQQRGIASLRYDKRGIANSAGASLPVTETRIEHFADDLQQWMGMVRDDERFGEVTLIGHSEGALISSMASLRSPPERLVSLAGAGRPAGDILREQLAKGLPEPLFAEAQTILEQLERGETVDEVPVLLSNVFHPKVQPYVISWLAHDPAEILAKITVPTMIIGGTSDIQVPVADAERMAAARPDAELCIVDDMNHVLKEATLEQESQSKAYSDPSMPLATGLVDCLMRFVGAQPAPADAGNG